MYGTAWALLPPLVAIILALIIKEAYSSLFIGVALGAFLVAGGKPVAALNTMISDEGGMLSAIADNAGIWVFLILLGTIVCLINKAGGSQAFGRWASEHIKTRVGAQLATFVLGILIFVDDYFNCLTVGSVMLPVTDGHNVSRAKLSYLIDATAAPICMIAPVSSWAAAVSSTAEGLDTGISGIELFVRAIPYNFYSLLTFVFIIGLVVMKVDFGSMRKHELAAINTGELGAQETQTSEDDEPNPKGKVIDLVFPIIVLIILCVLGMIYVGGFFGKDWWGESGNEGKFIGAFGNTDSFIGLPWGTIVALVVIVIFLLCRRVITFKDAMSCLPKGMTAMAPAIIILTLAVSLKNMTSQLGAAEFVHDVMEGASANLYSMLPAVIFIVAVFLAFASGTSWGTFGILIPIVTAVFPTDSQLLFVGISACLAGAVCGDHCSPISDTTIMASAGAQVDHVTHVSTQLPYAITMAAISFVTFIVAGFVHNAVVCIIIGAALTLGTLAVIKRVQPKDDGASPAAAHENN